MFLKKLLLLLLLLLNLNSKSQDLEIIHNISSNQTYQIFSEEDEKLILYLNFYSPRLIDYSALPYFFVSGWYELNEISKKYNLVGIYCPFNRLILFVPEDSTITRIDYLDNNRALNLDTTRYLEKFYFPLNDNSRQSVWFNSQKQKKSINRINFDNKNVNHTVFLKGVDYHLNQSIDITDFVLSPFGNNDIFLEDYNIKIFSCHRDSLSNLHILLFITNEYVIPSSSSSGGYYYLMLDKYQFIREYKYFETYNQGKYISYFDESFIHPTKKRCLIIADWDNGQVIGSFFIHNSRIDIENEW